MPERKIEGVWYIPTGLAVAAVGLAGLLLGWGDNPSASAEWTFWVAWILGGVIIVGTGVGKIHASLKIKKAWHARQVEDYPWDLPGEYWFEIRDAHWASEDRAEVTLFRCSTTHWSRWSVKMWYLHVTNDQSAAALARWAQELCRDWIDDYNKRNGARNVIWDASGSYPPKRV